MEKRIYEIREENKMSQRTFARELEGKEPKYILDEKSVKAINLFNNLSPKAKDALIHFLESIQEEKD